MNGDITAVDLLVLSHANTPRFWSVLCSVWKGAMYTALQVSQSFYLFKQLFFFFTGSLICFHHNSLLPEEGGVWASQSGFVKWAQCVEGMKWCQKSRMTHCQQGWERMGTAS